MNKTKHIKILGHSYRFQRFITESQMIEFKKHRGADRYYFKKGNNGRVEFYIRNNTESNASGVISKYKTNLSTFQ